MKGLKREMPFRLWKIKANNLSIQPRGAPHLWRPLLHELVNVWHGPGIVHRRRRLGAVEIGDVLDPLLNHLGLLLSSLHGFYLSRTEESSSKRHFPTLWHLLSNLRLLPRRLLGDGPEL